MDAIRDTQNAQPAEARAPGGAEVQARAQLALDVTPKRFRLIGIAAVRLPLRLLDTLSDALGVLLRLLF